ncbi:phosphatidate phosphatase LPIN2 isoform X3 [Hermetia illucens]|uniref:phosphatidate phosphatase LPIN2 isoform X3 n=1 Tax=Hermetia illucens TaxID=343691 RepID=UPI0018CC2DCF|nr:phosphatidate phosphatase LPIN2 isoform X3 [Hermetia illucens]
MNSLVRVFSNFKEFYSEINGATLTGAIDVIVVEQPDGKFQCSPFHVRFGKLGVLRSREKVVDIEINGDPVDIHMKLGESGEAFFVEECLEDEEEIPENLATSPIPSGDFTKKYEQNDGKQINEANESMVLPLPIPRRNSFDLSKEHHKEETIRTYNNQISDFSQRRHTEKLERRDLTNTKKEFTTQKIRQEWAEHEDELFPLAGENGNCSVEQSNEHSVTETKEEISVNQNIKEESKSKKKRRKKSLLKKKNAQRKSSSSSSLGSVQLESNDNECDGISLSNNTGSSNDESPIKNDISSPKVDSNKEEAFLGDTKMSNVTIDKENTISRIRDLDIHFFSDTEVASGCNVRGSRPSTPIQSDSELEISQREKTKQTDVMTNSASWKWGELPITQIDEPKDAPEAQRHSMLSGMFSFMKRNNKLRKNATEGVYLSDLDAGGVDPEMMSLYFPSIHKNQTKKLHDDDVESGNGTSLPQSPSSLEGPKSLDSDFDDGKSPDKYLDLISLSLCNGLDKGGPTDEEFNQHIVKYSDVCQNPEIFLSPNLVVRLNGKYYSWLAACPIVMTIITFQKPLSNEAIEQITSNIQKTMPSQTEDITMNQIDDITETQIEPEPKRRYWRWWGRGSGEKPDQKEIDVKDADQSAIGTQTSARSSPNDNTNCLSDEIEAEEYTLKNIALDQTGSAANTSKNEKFRKTLRLSSEQIKSLNLKPGMNEVEFSVTTAYQGTTRCKCYLFRWKYSDKVVISDIDGTITKSDVLGHILPMVGKDWAQIGVAPLFSKIEENGYKLLYLSARAIGQSRATREYLRSIRQGDVKLPDGPLLLNPTSLISAFHREVIERKPEQFKIACLSDIQTLFPENPFYAGYGNRINDVWAYRAVGIPIMRIFTINTKGELKHELTQTFQSSYCSMTYIVDQLFPPIKDDEGAVEYSSFNYWREPVYEIDLEIQPVDPTVSITQSTLHSLSKPLPTIPENEKN